MSRSRIRVVGSDAWWVAIIGAAAGVGVVLAGPSPTGSTPVDAVLVIGATAACVWASASAPWWCLVIAASITAIVAPSAALLVLAVAAAVASLAIGRTQRPVPWARAFVMAVVLQVLARLGNLDRFGFSAAVGISLAVVVAVAGITRRPRRERRVMWAVAGGVAVGAVLAGLGFGVAAASSRPHLEQGVDATRAGMDLLADGELDAAGVEFARAAEQFDRADAALSRPWAQPVRLLPVVAQHRSTAARLVEAANDVSATAAQVLSVVDYDALRVTNGSIDIAAIEAIQEPLARLDASLDAMTAALADADSPWLVEPLRTELEEVRQHIVDEQTQGDRAIAAVNLAPQLLGADEPRVYFIAFTTPAEARGLGGFMGNWAEVTITNGDIEVTRFGRTSDLNEGGDVAGRKITGMDEFLERYGKFGFREADGGTKDNIWSDVTMSPHFPSVAEVIAQLYPQSGGQELDGVFSMDVFTIAALMEITGPVELSALDFTVTPENAAEFLLNGQYVALGSSPERVDMLEEVALTTVQRLLTSTLPAPPDLVKLLSPFSAEGRLNAWAARPEEQALYKLTNMDGGLPELNGGDGVAITFNNAGNNKIDYFLDATATYSVELDDADAFAGATLRVDVRNQAPSSGQPPVVIGNNLGRPDGTNAMYLSVFAARPLSSATIDGTGVAVEETIEQGYRVYSMQLNISAGESADVELHFEPEADEGLISNPEVIHTRSNPGVRPATVRVVRA